MLCADEWFQVAECRHADSLQVTHYMYVLIIEQHMYKVVSLWDILGRFPLLFKDLFSIEITPHLRT